MAFWTWLWQRFAKKPVTRDVLRLASAGSDVDIVAEVVDTSGGPLKAGHCRRAIRDPRLLPKKKPALGLPAPRQAQEVDGSRSGEPAFLGQALRGATR